MSYSYTPRQNNGSKRVASVWAAGVLACAFAASALGGAVAPAMAQSNVAAAAHRGVDPRHFRSEVSSRADKRFVPANGAQIMGGFAGPDDLIDNATGETRHR